MMLKKISVFLSVFVLTITLTARAEISPQAEESIREYVQQLVYHSMLKTTSDIIQRAITQNNLEVLPPVGVQGMQQVVLQCFKQEATSDIIRDAFEEGVEFGKNQLDQGTPSDQIQRSLRTVIDRELDPLVKEPIYRRIIEEVIKQSASQSRKILMLQVAQRAAQMAAIQQRQRVLQQAMIRQYQQAIQQQISEQVVQRITQQVEQNVQQQVNQLQAQDAQHRQQLQQQYQQQYEQQIRQNYPSGVY